MNPVELLVIADLNLFDEDLLFNFFAINVRRVTSSSPDHGIQDWLHLEADPLLVGQNAGFVNPLGDWVLHCQLDTFAEVL